MATYPGGIYSPRTKNNKEGVAYVEEEDTTLFAEDVVKDDEEIVAIETELGINPKGVYGDVAARLDDMSGGGGAEYYDAVVAPSGADYDSVADACAGEDAGATIFIRKGTYIETADVVMKSGQRLIGEHRELTVIDFDNSAYQVKAAGSSGTHFESNSIENLTVKGSTDSYGQIYFYYVDDPVIKYCKIINGSYEGLYMNYCYRAIISKNYFLNKDAAHSGQLCYLVRIYGLVVEGNTFEEGLYQLWPDYIYRARLYGNFFWSGTYQFVLGGGFGIIYSGNYHYNPSVYVINFQDPSAGALITGNYFEGGLNNIGGSDAHYSIDFRANHGIFQIEGTPGGAGKGLTQFIKMKNTSGGTLAGGTVVVLKAVASGDEIDTTTIHGDPLVFGMVEIIIGNNQYASVRMGGKTNLLKVNGLLDIAIGDFLTTHTDAGIACICPAGKLGFAIALEAYTNNDSNGVIDALLIAPRKI